MPGSTAPEDFAVLADGAFEQYHIAPAYGLGKKLAVLGGVEERMRLLLD